MNKSFKSQKIKQCLTFFTFFVLGVTALVLLLLPATYFDSGQSNCVSVLLLNKQCYGCGMTRAIQHLIHLDFLGAYYYNKLSFVVFPLLVYLIIIEFKKTVLKYRTNRGKDL